MNDDDDDDLGCLWKFLPVFQRKPFRANEYKSIYIYSFFIVESGGGKNAAETVEVAVEQLKIFEFWNERDLCDFHKNHHGLSRIRGAQQARRDRLKLLWIMCVCVYNMYIGKAIFNAIERENQVVRISAVSYVFISSLSLSHKTRTLTNLAAWQRWK